MMAKRIEHGVNRGQQVELSIDGVSVSAWEGETLASVLLLHRRNAFYLTHNGAPRAPFCNMGTCFECRVHLEGRGWVLACMNPVESGMKICTEGPLPRIEVTGSAR